MKTKTLISRIEKRAGSPTQAYRMLKINESSWVKYKSGLRVLPPYIRQSIRAHLMLSDHELFLINVKKK